mgnify:CR=1 FL=1
MDERWKVGRVIARPFIGRKKGEFKRTPNRHDYALKPFGKTVLNSLKDAGLDVVGVGKIPDIFVDEGITKGIHTVSNKDGMEKTIELAEKEHHGLIRSDLVHRRNAAAGRKRVSGPVSAPTRELPGTQRTGQPLLFPYPPFPGQALRQGDGTCAADRGVHPRQGRAAAL